MYSQVDYLEKISAKKILAWIKKSLSAEEKKIATASFITKGYHTWRHTWLETLNFKLEAALKNKKWEIIMEAFRVLKVGGRLKIFELFSICYEHLFVETIEHLQRQTDLLKHIRDDEDVAALKRSGKAYDAAYVFQKLGKN